MSECVLKTLACRGLRVGLLRVRGFGGGGLDILEILETPECGKTTRIRPCSSDSTLEIPSVKRPLS